MSRRIASRLVLSRYERSSSGVYYLDVSAGNVADLYNSYDKSAPFVRRDLDQDLVAFLIECCRDLRAVPFEIRLALTEDADEEKLSRIRHSIASYFSYLVETERHDMRRRYRRSWSLVIVGVGILFGSVALRRISAADSTVPSSVLIEGMSILAWVAIWEASAMFILEWLPYRRRIAAYTKLATAPVSLRDQALLTQHSGLDHIADSKQDVSMGPSAT